jgi:hypothetical protein
MGFLDRFRFSPPRQVAEDVPAPAAAPAAAAVAKAATPQPRPLAIGVVFDRHGKPKLEESFVNALTPVRRVHVNNILLARGFKLTDVAPYYTEAD